MYLVFRLREGKDNDDKTSSTTFQNYKLPKAELDHKRYFDKI